MGPVIENYVKVAVNDSTVLGPKGRLSQNLREKPILFPLLVDSRLRHG